LALLLALLPALDRFVAAPTARGAAVVSGACLALYFGHEAMMFVYAGSLLLLTLLAGRSSLRLTAVRLVPLAIAVAVTLLQLRVQAGLRAPFERQDTLFMPFALKLAGTPSVVFSNYDAVGARVLFGIVAAAILWMVVRRARASTRSASAGLARLREHRFELIAACCAAAYLAYPATMNGATYVYHRFLAPALALTLISGAPRGRLGLDRVSRGLCALLPVATMLVLWPAFIESSRNYDDLEALLPLIDKASAVATIATAPNYNGYVRGSLAVRAVTERGGRMLYSFVESPIAPVRFARDKEWVNPVERVESDQHEFCPRWDLTRFKYLLMNTPKMELQYLATLALKPEARLVATRGEWALFESTLPVVPIDAPDALAPAACREDTIAARMDRAFAEVSRRIGQQGSPDSAAHP
jgi:hypothetical protein